MKITTFVKPTKVTANEYREDIKALAAAGVENEHAAGEFIFPTEERDSRVRKIQKAANEIDKTATIQKEDPELDVKNRETGNTIIIVTLGKKHAVRRKGGTVNTGADSVETPNEGASNEDVAESADSE